jgi:hypothetical protein
LIEMISTVSCIKPKCAEERRRWWLVMKSPFWIRGFGPKHRK